jgi:adenylate cyclase
MTTQELKRKLTAILNADVKGYSRLMGEDEEGTVRTLNAYKEVMTGLIQHHRGRLVDAPGDNVLAEFNSVVDAVKCAVEIQKKLKNRNAELPENRRMEFRIGVNLGDVIENGDRIYGDGLNISARLESLSEAGGICISGTAFDQVKNKLNLGYLYLGQQTVKNILEPVRVYRVLMEPEAAGKVLGEKKSKPRQWKKTAFVVASILILVIAAVAIWGLYFRTTATLETASKEKIALPLPDKPSIAVLPFTNMSKDPQQEYFSDGLTEEIINGLSKVPQIFVIARNSTFTYKGKTVDIKQVGRELGVQYVMEGSVRREGNRLRITAQLIDATTGRHVFSERYDRELKDIFATQDEITIKVLTALQVALTEGEYARFKARGVSNVEAYFKLLEAWDVFQRMNKENNARVRHLAEEALSLEPGSSRAYAIIGMTHFWDYWLDPAKSPDESIAQGIKMADKAIALDKDNSYAHGVLAMLYVNKGEYDKAVEEAEVAASLDNGALTNLGSTLMHACLFTEAISVFQKALRLNPLRPHSSCLMNLANSYRLIGQYDQSVQYYKKLLQNQPDHFPGNLGLTATYSEMGRMEDARKQAAEVLRIDPKFSLERSAKLSRYKNPVYKERTLEALRNAGLT